MEKLLDLWLVCAARAKQGCFVLQLVCKMKCSWVLKEINRCLGSL